MAEDREHHAIASGRGRWSPDDPTPKFGWARQRVIDRGAGNLTTCEMCESANIRYEHHMYHPDGHHLVVGCICSGYMTLSGHYAEVDHDELVRAMAEATEVDKRIRAVEGKLRSRTKARDADAVELQSFMAHAPGYDPDTLRLYLLKDELPRLLKRAMRREAEVVAVEDAYHDMFGVADEHIDHRKQIEAAIAETKRLLDVALEREHQHEMFAFLDAPSWRRTPKGFRAISPQGDTLQAFRNQRGDIKAMVQRIGRPQRWGTRIYDDFDAAKRQAARVLERELIESGRLPELRPESGPRWLGWNYVPEEEEEV